MCRQSPSQFAIHVEQHTDQRLRSRILCREKRHHALPVWRHIERGENAPIGELHLGPGSRLFHNERVAAHSVSSSPNFAVETLIKQLAATVRPGGTSSPPLDTTHLRLAAVPRGEKGIT
jgi:hypothetical protein